MADPKEPRRKARFTGPGNYILWMVVFLAVVLALAAALHQPLILAFEANPAINGLILGVLFIGILYTFQQALAIGPSARWLVRLNEADHPDQLPSPPALIAPMAALITDAADGRSRLSAASARVVLDSVAARMAESGAFTRYFGRLLIFLGLLGTFYGLLLVVSDVGDAVRAVSATSSGAGETDAMALMSAIEEPIAGMGTAFASSLFGLAGSLIIGFLELQASRAQNRFYNEVEEWLSTISRLSNAGPQGASADEAGGSGAYVGALLEQSADALDRLTHTLERHTRQLETIMTRFADDAAESQRESARLLRDEIKVLVRALEAQARLNRERGQDRNE
ncbi:MAG: hypothetical protein CMH90_02395 [Oceanicaulis sp.]|uniref:hypothetical protein n=1 Tax=Oceanicaulis sp. UBA2681 TaxID=1947007 RepID=UPI000C0AAAF4|nr:hypothetical protein [Oceanicaulis sp. UBA2681]MAP48308.1 hypothetical protein [Oceanicaulis sp.]|tara:strand:- start:11162 stop:12175 length:1014 start_codon:yes stop_codon:yes gene_type:complete